MKYNIGEILIFKDGSTGIITEKLSYGIYKLRKCYPSKEGVNNNEPIIYTTRIYGITLNKKARRPFRGELLKLVMNFRYELTNNFCNK